MGIKGEISKAKIIEGATYCLVHFGDRKTTFQLIADHCGVSQALVVRHLKSRENLFAIVLEHWILWARRKTETAVAHESSPENRLRRYLSVSLDLFLSGEFSRIYLLLHYFAGVEERFRVANTEIKNVAVLRISKILEDGIAQGCFRHVDISLTAKAMHNYLVGTILSALTESRDSSYIKLPALLEESCLSLVRP